MHFQDHQMKQSLNQMDFSIDGRVPVKMKNPDSIKHDYSNLVYVNLENTI